MLKRGVPFTVLALFLAIAPACAPSKVNKGAGVEFRPTQTFPEAQSLAQKAGIACPDTRNCPSAIALLTAANADPEPGVGMCTGFLISKNLLVTNTHCIPADLRKRNASCEDRIWAHFPRTVNRNSELRACKKVRSHSELDLRTPHLKFDIALIELDQPADRVPLKISSKGLKDDEAVTLFKVDPAPGERPFGVVSHVSCKAKHGNLHVPNNTHPGDSVQSIADCETRQGNSGSPALDSRSRVRAVLHAGTDDQTLNRLQKEYADQLNGEILVPVSFASNVACFPFDKKGRELRILPKACSKSMSASPRKNPHYIWNARQKLMSAAALLNPRQIDETQYPIFKLEVLGKVWRSEPKLNQYLQLDAEISELPSELSE